MKLGHPFLERIKIRNSPIKLSPIKIRKLLVVGKFILAKVKRKKIVELIDVHLGQYEQTTSNRASIYPKLDRTEIGL